MSHVFSSHLQQSAAITKQHGPFFPNCLKNASPLFLWELRVRPESQAEARGRATHYTSIDPNSRSYLRAPALTIWGKQSLRVQYSIIIFDLLKEPAKI